MVGDDREAEEHAAEWMRYLGYTDATCTPPGAGGGVDVVSARAAAAQKKGVFFSLAGYTEQARAFADSVGVALFPLDPRRLAAAHQRCGAPNGRGCRGADVAHAVRSPCPAGVRRDLIFRPLTLGCPASAPSGARTASGRITLSDA
jgi:hypothetical protein